MMVLMATPEDRLQRERKIIENMDSALKRRKTDEQREKLIKGWEKEILEQEESLKRKSLRSKQEALRVMEAFRNMYVLEDSEGEEYTKGRLERMTHQELISLCEYYLEELRKDVPE